MTLVSVGNSVAIGVGEIRVGSETRLFKIDEAVAVGIVERGFGDECAESVARLPAVRHPVAVRVGEARIRPGEEFREIRKTVRVGVERGVRGIGRIETVISSHQSGTPSPSVSRDAEMLRQKYRAGTGSVGKPGIAHESRNPALPVFSKYSTFTEWRPSERRSAAVLADMECAPSWSMASAPSM